MVRVTRAVRAELVVGLGGDPEGGGGMAGEVRVVAGAGDLEAADPDGLLRMRVMAAVGRAGVWGVGVPELGFGVVGVAEDAVGPVGVGVAAEGEVAGAVVAGFAGELALGVFFGGAFGAAIDVEPDGGLAGVDEGLGEVEGGEGMGVGGVAELPEDGGDLVVGGGGGGGEG